MDDGKLNMSLISVSNSTPARFTGERGFPFLPLKTGDRAISRAFANSNAVSRLISRPSEKASIDRVFLVKCDPLQWGYPEILEFSDCQCLHLDEVPLMGKLQNRRPFLDTGIVKGVFSAATIRWGEKVYG